MTVNELVQLPAKKVRNDNDLMHLYIQYYKDAFSFAPNCAPCTFNRDFVKLQKHITGSKTISKQPLKSNTMATSENKYKLKRKHNGDILTYQKSNKGKRYRMYGKNVTDEFAEAYIKNAPNATIRKEREGRFEVLPVAEKKAETKKTESKKEETK